MEVPLKADRVCRTCLIESDGLISVFYNDTQQQCRISLMVSTCTEMKIRDNDGLPDKICPRCLESARVAFAFKKQCDLSARTLHALASGKKLTAEEMDPENNTRGTQTDVMDQCKRCISKLGGKQDSTSKTAKNTRGNEDLLLEVEYLEDDSGDKSPMNVLFQHVACKMELDNVEYLTETFDEVVKKIKNEPALDYESDHDIGAFLDSSIASSSDEDEKDKKDQLLGPNTPSKDSAGSSLKDSSGNYKCEYCDKHFGRSTHLRRHILIHTKEKPYKCRYCLKAFSRRDHMINHQSTCHAREEPFPGGKNDLDEKDPTSLSKINKCDECDKVFARVSHLKLHQLSHTNEKPFICEHCSAAFSRSDRLTLHLTTCNGQEQASDVNSSNVSIPDDGNDPDKTTIETKKQPWTSGQHKCEHCDKVFNRSTHLKRHILTHTNEKPFQCKYCSKAFSRRENMASHQAAMHPDELKLDVEANIGEDKKEGVSDQPIMPKIHKCEHCEKIFTRATHLKRHVLTHTNEKPFQCQHCAKAFSRRDHMTIHETTFHSQERPYACELCEKTFKRSEHLRTHTESKHSDATGEAKKLEICDVCQKGFATVKYMEMHRKKHFEPKIHTCQDCGEQFSDKVDLRQHMKQVHLRGKSFLCSECGQSFVRHDYLLIHMRRHNGIKPYKCKFCPKAFPRATDLKMHEKYHTNEKKHVCNICGKGFHRGYNLIVHMRTHNGIKPYKCPHCPKGFAQGNDLKAHVRRHTGERYKCEICDEGFIQCYQLTNHKRTAHNIETPTVARRVTKFITQTAQEQQVLLQQHHQELEQLVAQQKYLEEQRQAWDIEQMERDPDLEKKILETKERIQDVERELDEINSRLHEELEQQPNELHYNQAPVDQLEAIYGQHFLSQPNLPPPAENVGVKPEKFH